MLYKKIAPIQVLNEYATEFIAEFPMILGDFSSRFFEIEFYADDGHPLLSRKGKVSGLPVDAKLVENVNPHTFFNNISQDAVKMLNMQDEIMMEEMKKLCGLTYYDDTFVTKCNRKFSYIVYLPPESDKIGKEIKL